MRCLTITISFTGSNAGPPDKSAKLKLFYYFSTHTYVVGTQKNRHNETSFEHPKHMFKLMDQKIIAILR